MCIRDSYSADDAAKYFPRIADWESGAATPTYRQLEMMADKFQLPVAAFFFPSPPDIQLTQQSFRTLPDHYFELIPRTVRSFVRKGQAMQLNLAELNDQRNPAETLITTDLPIRSSTSVENIALKVRAYLGISLAEQYKWATVEDALEGWRDAFARAGVFVFKDAFHAEGYFGFCLYDKDFPIIYVNNSSTKTRQLFTLFHELAHLLFHTSGIDVVDDSYIGHLAERERRVEIMCNQFAAAFLVPDEAFSEALTGRGTTRDTAALLADRFKVSREVIYRKLLNRELISEKEYEDAAASWAKQATPKERGGNYYYNQIAYLGARYIDLALTRYNQHRFDSTQLAAYLNIKPKNVEAFEFVYAGLK